MESPPSSSSWSQAFILSDDSGLLLTTGSFSSGNLSSEKRQYHYEDSDCEERSLSQYDSLDGMSDVICGENFNTLKKGPHWTEMKQSVSPIEPPLEFQDGPLPISVLDFFCAKLTKEILETAFSDAQFNSNSTLKKYMKSYCLSPPPPLPCRTKSNNFKKLATNNSVSKSSPHLNRQSPYRSCRSFPSPTSTFASSASPYVSHTPRPSSRSSLGGSSRLSSSHNSLSVPHTRKVDDSTFITQAVSHDTLSSNLISDLYNVPFDSDVYAVPVDVVHTSAGNDTSFNRGGETYSSLGSVSKSLMGGVGGGATNASSCGGAFRRKRRNLMLLVGNKENQRHHGSDRTNQQLISEKNGRSSRYETKRHSVAGTSSSQNNEPIHMSLQEVRMYLQTLYSSSSNSSETNEDSYKKRSGNLNIANNNNNNGHHKYHSPSIGCLGNNQISIRPKKPLFLKNIKNKKVKDNCDSSKHLTLSSSKKEDGRRRIFNLKQALCNIFRFRRFLSVAEKTDKGEIEKNPYEINKEMQRNSCLSSRALPPLPRKEQQPITEENTVQKKEENEEMKTNNNQVVEQQALDFSASLRRVKDYGWYWGPISCEAAEKILSNEPDGSFIVRDSSDDHYIFSLTFKLNNSVRHVRIDHDQGNFSFGNCTKFKSQTIVDFIENAVEHSRSGRYLFFLHRRPVIGPVRVQLLHPVSRFKQVQSLQHMCRFIIHKNVRVDLIPKLPLPRRMIDYLNTPHYYAEHLMNGCDSDEQSNNSPSLTEPEGRSFRDGFAPTLLLNNRNNDRRFINISDRNTETNNNDNTNNISNNHLNNVPVNEYIVFNATHSNNSNNSIFNGRNTPFEPIFRNT